MSQKQQIDIEYKHIYGEPMPLPDGRVQVAVFDRITWHCACGLPLLYFGQLSWKIEHECGCGRRYEIDGAHGITPRVSLLVDESEETGRMIELQEITFHEIQRHFFAVWEAEQEDPQEVHIADADYDALVLSAFPVREFDAFDRYLLGEEEVNRFIREDEERRRKPVARVLNQCTGAYVHLIRHAEQQQGTIYFSGKNDRSWVFKNVFADESL